MSWTKNNAVLCDGCGKFCRPYDSEVPFGCHYAMDGEIIGPLDPYDYCKLCARKLYHDWKANLKRSHHNGYWQKSRAECRAAKVLGLVWVGSNGLGTLGSENWVSAYQYVPKEQYERLKSLPYWGWCKECGAERKGGYCSIPSCNQSFENKVKTNIAA